MTLKLGFVVVFHNAEEYVARVMDGVISCLGNDDVLVVVADGCTDLTTEKCRKSISLLTCESVFLETSDLHEIGALNESFKALEKYKPDYVVHVQGDMILDPKTFPIVKSRIDTTSRIGLISLRMGGCPMVDADSISISYKERNFGHNYKGTIQRNQKVILEECCIAGRGPIIISSEMLIANAWTIDNNLKPHSMDDVDMSFLALEMNLRNYSINLPYRSDVTWGATRNPNRSYQDSVDISALKNLSYVIAKHSNLLADIVKPHTHSAEFITDVKIGFNFLLGSLINRELLSSKSNFFRRVRKKIAYLVSTKSAS
jgi:glycosyltransferase involved in cell wall biosynthesis